MRVAVVHDSLADDASPDQRDVLTQAELVCRALQDAGHQVVRLSADLDLARLARELRRDEPELVFNLVESLGGAARLIHLFPALLEQLRMRFTGCSSQALLLSSSKPLAKRLLRDAGLPTPDWVESAGLAESPAAARRWMIKPVWEDASVGIDDASIVYGSAADALASRQPAFGGELFAEAYIDGRELNLSLLAAADEVELLPPAEIRFEDFPADRPRIVGYAAKWHEDSFEYRNTPRSFEFGCGDRELLAGLGRLARACWRVLGLRGYARVDFRVDSAGQPWILEANANPCLSPDAGFLAAAARAGLAPRQVIERIVAAALAAPLGQGG